MAGPGKFSLLFVVAALIGCASPRDPNEAATELPAQPAPSAVAPLVVATPVSAELPVGIKRISDTEWEIERPLFERVIDPAQVARQARLVPMVHDGQPNGFKFYLLRTDSVLANLGLLNGDTITAINAMELSGSETGLETYEELRDAKDITINVIRRGQAVTLHYLVH